MSVFTNKPFSRLWRGRSGSDALPNSVNFAGDAAPPFAELASGSEPIPTAEEVARIRYYHSKMAVRDADFVVRVYMCLVFLTLLSNSSYEMTADLCAAPRIWI